MWYIFKYNSLPKVDNYAPLPDVYAGLDGCSIPLCDFDPRYYNKILEQREYLILPNGHIIFVFTDLNIVFEYYKYAETFCGFWREINLEEHGYILQVEYASELLPYECDGYDYGLAEGGWSLSFELLLRFKEDHYDSLKKIYLNEYGLFRTYDLMMKYKDTERTVEMKSDDEYYDPVAITILVFPPDTIKESLSFFNPSPHY